MEVLIKEFRTKFLQKQQPAELAAEFATKVGPQRLINISSMKTDGGITVYVWYWSDDPSSTDPHNWKTE